MDILKPVTIFEVIKSCNNEQNKRKTLKFLQKKKTSNFHLSVNKKKIHHNKLNQKQAISD